MDGSGELLESVRHLPDLVRDVAIATADIEGLPDREGVTEVVLLGTGMARVAGDVVATLAEIEGRVPVIASGARCPAWARPSTLVVAVASMAEDAAVTAAAQEAQNQGARVVAVTRPGALSKWASANSVPVVAVDAETGPAAGIGVAIVPALVLLERMGLAAGMSRLISGSAAQLDERRGALDRDRTLVEGIAADLPERIAIIAGAGAIGKHAARRWVQEIDRSGGVAAVRRRLPVNDQDVATWARLTASSAHGVTAVLLRHDFEPEGLVGGVDLVTDAVDAVHEVVAAGDGALAQLLDLVLVGDAVAASLGGGSGPSSR